MCWNHFILTSVHQLLYLSLYIFVHDTCVRVYSTNLQRGRQYAEAVQTVVELRVGGPPEEGLPELRLTFALRRSA